MLSQLARLTKLKSEIDFEQTITKQLQQPYIHMLKKMNIFENVHPSINYKFSKFNHNHRHVHCADTVTQADTDIWIYLFTTLCSILSGRGRRWSCGLLLSRRGPSQVQQRTIRRQCEHRLHRDLSTPLSSSTMSTEQMITNTHTLQHCTATNYHNKLSYDLCRPYCQC